ncbi:rab-GTPase-TBC domain-containing protein [Phycomyces blakesleeanus]
MCHQELSLKTSFNDILPLSYVNKTEVIIKGTFKGVQGGRCSLFQQLKPPSYATLLIEAQIISTEFEYSPSHPSRPVTKTIILTPHVSGAQTSTFTFISTPKSLKSKLPVKLKFIVDNLDSKHAREGNILMHIIWVTFIVDCLLGAYFLWNHVKPTVLLTVDSLSEPTSEDCSIKEKEDILEQIILGPCPLDQKKILAKFANPTYSTEYQFNYLANKITSHESLIADSLHDMAPLQPLFDSKERRDQLRSVLRAYAVYDESLGYCQGMNFIAGCLLEHLPPNEALGVMVTLLGPNPGSHRLRYIFHSSTYELYASVEKINSLMSIKLPRLYQHMVQENIHPSMYAVRWYRTFFGHSGPKSLLINTINLVLLKGSDILPYCLLAVLKANEDKLKTLDYTELPRFLNKSIFDVFKVERNSFVQDTLCLAKDRFLIQNESKYAVETSDDEDSCDEN